MGSVRNKPNNNCWLVSAADHYLLKYPREEYKTGRKLRCSPLHTRLEVAGAVFGETMAYERAIYFNLESKFPDFFVFFFCMYLLYCVEKCYNLYYVKKCYNCYTV